MPASRKISSKPKGKPKVPRITYATLRITPDDDKVYDNAVTRVRGQLGTRFAMYVNGEKWVGTGEEATHVSPVNTGMVVSYFPKGTREDVKAAVDAARDAYPEWSSQGYKDRTKVLRKVADLIIERRYELSAWMAFEVGKNRAESLAEVNEAAELIRYYCDQMEQNKGFTRPMEPPGPKQ